MLRLECLAGNQRFNISASQQDTFHLGMFYTLAFEQNNAASVETLLAICKLHAFIVIFALEIVSALLFASS